LSTLHTLDATETIQRIIAVFPPPEQKQIRLQLAGTLKAVISQRLVRKADGSGRVPAVEVMITTGYIRDCIINPDKTRMIRDAIAAGTSQYGMQTFDQSLFDLYSRNLITFEEAILRASNPDDFRLRVQGVRSSADSAREDMERAMNEFELVTLRNRLLRGSRNKAERGELFLVFPTIKHLEQLSVFQSADALLEHARGREVNPVQPRVVGQGETARIVLPGEPGYAE